MRLRLLSTVTLILLSGMICFAKSGEPKVIDKQLMEQHLKDYLSGNYKCLVKYVAVDAKEVIVQGDCTGYDGKLALAEVTPCEDITEMKVFNHIFPLKGKKFEIKLDRYAKYDGYTYDRLLSRWAVVRIDGNRHTLVSAGHYADEVEAISSPEALVPVNKKGVGAGLGAEYMNDLVELDAHNITVNWIINAFIASSPIFNKNTEYKYGGETYYIDGDQIADWDNYLTFYEKHGIAVSAIVLIAPSATDDKLTAVFRHPEWNGGNYTMPNMTAMRNVNVYAAILNYLAARYNGSGHGRVNHWIMHNEVDMDFEWTNMGEQPELLVQDAYMKSMRLCYNIVRQYDQNASILGSYTHNWMGTIGGHFRSKNLLVYNVLYSALEGDFWWGVAYHPYPQDLNKSDFWVDDTLATNNANSIYCTFKNLEVVNDWILQPQNRYKGGVKRNLFLSENGTNSPSYSMDDLAHQAAGGCWAWKKANALEGIDAIMWHNWMDNREEYNLRIGLHYYPDDENNPGGKKTVWHVWQAAGTPQEDAFFEPYKAIIGIDDWSEIFMPLEGGE